MHGCLPNHSVGSEENWSLLEEFNFFAHRYLTLSRRKFQNWISGLNLKARSPLGALNCWLHISAIPFGTTYFSRGLGYYWRILPGIFSCPPGEGSLALSLNFRNNTHISTGMKLDLSYFGTNIPFSNCSCGKTDSNANVFNSRINFFSFNKINKILFVFLMYYCCTSV